MARSFKPSSNRRQFLTGQAAADALAAWADGAFDASVAAAPQSSDPASAPYRMHFQRRAMACQFEVILNAGQHARSAELAIAALDLVETLETQMTVYRGDSEIIALNRLAAKRPVAVEPRLFRLIEQAVALHRESNGAFDITAGPLSQAWGFSRRQGRVPNEAELAAAIARVGSERIELDSDQGTVRFTQPEIEINLNSIGKGYALDRCAELMQAEGLNDFLWQGGNSSVLARGSSGGSDAGGGWIVGVGDPTRPGGRLAEIRLRDRALGTSGAAHQFFRHDGRRFGHILDPRTGWPAERMLSVTVVAPTAAEADALATAFYVMGVDDSVELCESRPEIGAALVFPNASGNAVELVTVGLNENDWRPVADAAH